MKELRSILSKMLHRKEMWQQYRQHLIILEWAEAVGQEIASVTQARNINKGKLWITVKDSTWSYHLSLLKPQLLAKLNDHAGGEMVHDIYFQVGEIIQQENQEDLLNDNLMKSELEDEPSSDGSFIQKVRQLREEKFSTS